MTDKISQAREIKVIKERLEIAVEAAEIGIWDWYVDSGYCYYNEKWAETLGLDLEELEHNSSIWENLVHPDDRDKIEEKLHNHFSGVTDTYKSEYRLKVKSGEYIWIRDIGRVVEKDEAGNPLRVTGVYINIDQSKNYQQKIEYLSFHDDLTGLYNRRYLENEIKRLKDSRKYPISIIIGDLDNLKEVNDSFGHGVGDQYIKNSAEILKDVLRSEDIIARTGGDEFAVILPETNAFAVKKICKRITRKFKEYNKKKAFPKKLSISLGNCTVKKSSGDLNKCYDIADKRMYINKGRR